MNQVHYGEWIEVTSGYIIPVTNMKSHYTVSALILFLLQFFEF